MAVIINLDITNSTKVTDYGLQVNTRPNPTINFLIRDENYSINYDNFIRLRLRIEKEFSKQVTTIDLNIANLVEENNRKYIKWDVPSDLIADLDKLNIDATVSMIGNDYSLSRFRIIVYKSYSFQMQAILDTINNFNEMYALYTDSVKRTEIGQPNGVVPLDENGKIDNSFLDKSLGEHITNTIYDTLYTIDDIHGLRINKVNYKWEYFDSDDQEWYQVNSIPGGKFGHVNKSSDRNVFGGNFTDADNIIDGGTLGDSISEGVDALTFDDELNSAYSGGGFI